MGSSDNVLRGGLTPKHVDVDALLGVVDFHASAGARGSDRSRSAPGVETYDSGVEAFRLLHVEAVRRAGRRARRAVPAWCW